jgi:hypothetical protein
MRSVHHRILFKELPMSQLDPAIKAIECRFAVYCPPQKGLRDDMHLVKEVLHYHDGRASSTNLRMIRNYKRPFYTTQVAHRQHHDKKEAELLTKLNVHSSRQCDLVFDIARALEYRGAVRGLKDICQVKSEASPDSLGAYVYGADISSTALLKRSYQTKYPVDPTPYTVATLDIETTVCNNPADVRILMCTVAMGDKVYTIVTEAFLAGYAHPKEQLLKLGKQYAEPLESVKRAWEIDIVADELQVCLKVIKKLHAWQPDILAIWNMIFDMKKMTDCLERHRVNPAEVWSDPSVPRAYQRYQFIEGSEFAITASGTRRTKEGSERWHTVACPASFYVIDAMCLYRAIRNQETKDPSYNLDAIMRKELEDRGKLYFGDLASADDGTAEWHIEMQQDFPLEYTVYNRYDTTGMLDLEAKTRDLTINLAFFSGVSDFANFSSQPRRIVDDLDAFYRKKGEIVSTTGKVKNEAGEFLDRFESLVIGRDGWIATLDPELFEESNSVIFCDAKGIYHTVHLYNADLDVTGAYPNVQCAMNVSKKTTHKELIDIEGVSQRVRRTQGLNLSGGYINAVEIGNQLFGLPQLDEWARAYRQDHPAAPSAQPVSG